MHDPITTFEKIRDFYITYLETAFRIGDKGVQQERRKLLEQIGMLATDPLVEPLPHYTSSGVSIENLLDPEIGSKWLPDFTQSERQAFVAIALGGIVPKDSKDSSRAAFPLYQHQLKMLKRGTQALTPGIVTSGTGSGKTESFLLPVMASIVKEAKSWPAAAYEGWKPWWQTEKTGASSCVV